MEAIIIVYFVSAQYNKTASSALFEKCDEESDVLFIV